MPYFEIDSYVPLRQLWWSKAEFSPGNAITGHRSHGLQVIQIGTGFFDELDIANALFKIEPDVIYVPSLPSNLRSALGHGISVVQALPMSDVAPDRFPAQLVISWEALTGSFGATRPPDTRSVSGGSAP